LSQPRIVATVLTWSLAFVAHPTPAAGQAQPTRWVLVYAGSAKGGHPAYKVDDFLHLLASTDSSGTPSTWLCSGIVFVHLYAASGRVFTTWIGGPAADGTDWSVYLDSLFSPGGALTRLDSAVESVERTAGVLTEKFPFSVMIPYPDPKSDSLRFAGKNYDLRSDGGRIAAAVAYIAAARERFAKAMLPRLRLDGFYWLLETMPPTDTAVVAGAARAVHAASLRLLWIPYYTSQGQERWRELGFDEAWLQPNYFFNRDVPATRLDSAANRATRMGMGLEIEFDGRLLSDPRFGDRLEPYLAELGLHPELKNHSLVIYEGGGALLMLARSTDPIARMRYQALLRALK
jgi:hypothetical protein